MLYKVSAQQESAGIVLLNSETSRGEHLFSTFSQIRENNLVKDGFKSAFGSTYLAKISQQQ